MSQEKVVSREYKIMLRANLFAGDERQLLKAARKFSQAFNQLIEPVVRDIDGDLAEVKHRRMITFYDTKTRTYRATTTSFVNGSITKLAEGK
jgi:hypothetical protein